MALPLIDCVNGISGRNFCWHASVGCSFSPEFVLILRIPLPSILPWSMVSIAGAATVLSFAVVADYFPREFAARANGALNLLHFGWAFLIQYGIGLVIEQWPSQDGHYPIAAYQSAFGLSAVLQLAALVWFALPWLGAFGKKLIHPLIARARACHWFHYAADRISHL